MEYKIRTNRQEFTLAVTVRTSSRQELRIILADTDLENTQYTNRVLDVRGEVTFYIQVPLCNMNAKLVIYNEATGNIPKFSDPTFTVIGKPKMLTLPKRYDLIDYNDTALSSFIKFAQRFSIGAGWITTGTYRSHDSRYFIEYLPDILSSDPPYLPLNTSMRIAKDNGLIQASQAKVEIMTVPGRMATLCHEYSHFFMNENIEDETEADINGLNIYLGLGYPRIDAENAFLDAFMGVDTMENMERMKIILDFINEYDSAKILIK